MKIKKRFAAGALSAVLAISFMTNSIMPTLASPTDTIFVGYTNSGLTSVPSAYQNTIFQAINKSGEGLEIYKYSRGFAALNNNPGAAMTAVRFADDFYIRTLSNEDNNVFFKLDGEYHTLNDDTSDLISGGEALNPATNGQPAMAVTINGNNVFIAGPYTSGQTKFYYVDGTYDAAAAAKQGATGDGKLQGPEAKTITDITAIYDAAAGTLTPTEDRLEPGETPVLGPVVDQDGDGRDDYLKPTGTENVYEVVDKDGTGKEPPLYVFDKNTDGDKDPTTNDTALVPAEKVENSGGDAQDGFYVKDSDVNNPGTEGIWHPVKPDGRVDPDTGVWAGPDEKIGNVDDVNADHVDTDFDAAPDTWYADHGDNIFTPVHQDGTTGDLVGGGPDKKPETAPVTPIYTHTDGTHFVGPMQDENGDDYYYGDPADGGDGLITSTAIGTNGDDVIFYLDANGNMVTKKPPVAVSGITLDHNTLELVKGTTGKQLKATLTPAHSTSTVIWSSDNANIVTVDQDGNVTPVAPGKAYITAMVDGKSAVCTVNVANSVEINDTLVFSPNNVKCS